GYFKRRPLPVPPPEAGAGALEADEYPRPDTTLEGLTALEASFAAWGSKAVGPNGETLDQMALKKYPQAGEIRHVHTAGNSSGIVDGAAAVLIASEDYVKAHGLKPRAKICGMATAGAEPVIMLTAPTPAAKKALAQLRMTPEDIDLWEINEAFAVVPMQTLRNLGVD